MNILKNIGIPGPAPSLYNGNLTELNSKVLFNNIYIYIYTIDNVNYTFDNHKPHP